MGSTPPVSGASFYSASPDGNRGVNYANLKLLTYFSTVLLAQLQLPNFNPESWEMQTMPEDVFRQCSNYIQAATDTLNSWGNTPFSDWNILQSFNQLFATIESWSSGQKPSPIGPIPALTHEEGKQYNISPLVTVFRAIFDKIGVPHNAQVQRIDQRDAIHQLDTLMQTADRAKTEEEHKAVLNEFITVVKTLISTKAIPPRKLIFDPAVLDEVQKSL